MRSPIQSDRPLRESLRPVIARKGVVLLAMALVPGAALVTSSRQSATYQATASVFLGQAAVPGDVTDQLRGTFKAPARAAKTQALLAHSPTIGARVLKIVPVQGESVDSLQRDSTVDALQGGDVLAFSVRSGNGQLAERLANEYAYQYTLFRRRMDQLPIEQALADLRGQGGSGSRTGAARQVRELRSLQAVTGTSPAVVDPAKSFAKTRPQTAQAVVAGLLLGTIFGVGLAFLWDALDSRIRSPDEIGDGLGLPELARVPKSVARHGPDSLPLMLTEPHSREAEAFRFLRAALPAVGLDGGVLTLMVTSARAGEGKGSVAANLAVAVAGTGRTVTLVDLDLRSPSIARSFHLRAGPGLTDVALGSATLGDALVRVPTQESGAAPSAGILRVLPPGPTPPDVGEFQSTVAFDSVLEEISSVSDLVIINAPPLLGRGDAITLARNVDAILLVAGRDLLRRAMVPEVARILADCRARKLGFVLTGADPERRRAGRDGSSGPSTGRPPGVLAGRPS